MNLQEEIDRLDATYLPPWQPQPRRPTRFGPHVRPALEREFGAAAIHPRVLPQFPIYRADGEAEATTGYVDYVAMSGDRTRVFFVH